MAKRTVSFDDAPPPGTINFSIGQPSADCLPLELVRQASEIFFAGAQPFDLNYGVKLGDAGFLDAVAGFLTRTYGHPTDAAQLCVTGGNSQSIDLASEVFAQPGDTVFVEEPSYFLAFQIFRDHGLKIVGIPMDDEGPSIEAFEQALRHSTPAFFYTVPSFHNPTGLSSSLARRGRVIELAKEHGFLVLADEPYQLLNCYGAPPPAYGTMVDSDVVISLGSFSKILAPGLRVGWMQTSERMLQQVLTSGLINSGGSVSHFSSLLVRHAIDEGLLEPHIEKLRATYRSRIEAMDTALHEHFDGLAKWTRPGGGYFFWLEFDESIDTSALREKARELETGFQLGTVFSSGGALNNFMRLSFAHYGEDDVHEGVARLRRIF